MATIGSLMVNLGMNNAEFTKGIKSTNKKLNKFSRSAKKGIRKISKAFDGVGKSAVVLGAVIGATAVKLVSMGSDFEETGSKFNTVFAGLENRAQGFSDELVRSFGTSQRESMLFLSSIQDLLVPMGVAADKAADLSFETVKLASDIGSFNNQPTAKVMDDISSALTGSFETMKKYGVVLNETVIKQRALEEGLGDSTGKVNAAEKAQLALKIITESSSAAIGDFGRTSDGFANSLKIVKSKIEDAASSLGADFLPQAKDVLLIVKESIPEMMALAKILGTGLVSAVKTAIPVIATLADGFGDLLRAVGVDLRSEIGKLNDEIEKQQNRQIELLASIASLNTASSLYKVRLLALKNVSTKLATAQQKLSKATEKVQKSMGKDIKFKSVGAIKKMNGELDKSNLKLKEFEKVGVSSFEALDAESQRFATNLEGNLAPVIKDVMTGGIKNVDDLGNAIGAILVTALATATASWIAVGIASSTAGVAMAAAWTAALGPIALVLAAVAGVVLVIQNLGTIFTKLDEFFRGFFASIIGVFDSIVNSLKQFVNPGKGRWETFFGVDLPFLNFADGGISSGFNPGIVNTPTFNAGGTARAGEAGAEAIVPLKGGAIPVALSGGGGGGGAQTITLILKSGDPLMSAIASELEVMSEDGKVKIDKSAIIDRAVI